MNGILHGYRVIDLSIAMAGPFASMRLGDLGADVIKVEPVNGEWQRHVSAGNAQGKVVNTSFLSLNRNKRSLAVDLKSTEGRQIVLDLVAGADVVVQNYRPGVVERLGLDYESVQAVNPSIIYLSLSGFGEDGPYRERPGQDLILQAMSGALYSGGRVADPPLAAPLFLVDAVAAYTAFEGVLAALLHRERTGQGQRVDVNMLDAITCLQMQEISIFSAGGVPQTRTDESHAHPYVRAPYGIFATSDGYLALAFPPLEVLGRVLGRPELSEMEGEVEGWTRRDEVFRWTREALAERSTSEWLRICAEHDVWAGPVNGYAELMTDPQVEHNKTFITYEHTTEGVVTTPGFPIHFHRSPSSLRYGAPLTGEHTLELLAELGIGSARVDELAADQIVANHVAASPTD